MNILSIGNSFSQDAQRYLHKIAKSDGVKINTFNLYIGGCPLSLHYRNIITEQNAYTLEMNGESTGFKISLKEALLNRDWNVVTIQQVSHQAPYYDTYQPYLDKLVEYIKLCVPKAKIAIHQTWAYEEDSYRLNTELGYSNAALMFADVEKAYKKAAHEINADFIIPSGELFQNLLNSGIKKLHRDTFHASLGLGRYALGLLWYTILTGRSVLNNAFCDFDEEIVLQEIETGKKCVSQMCKN